MVFTLSGIRVFAEKVISEEDAERIERRMGMVKVIEPIIEKAVEMRVEEAVEKAEKRAKAEGRKQGKEIGRKQGKEIGIKQGWANAQKEIARNFLKTGADSGMVASITGLSLEQVVKLQKEAIAE